MVTMDKVYQDNPNVHAGKPRHKTIAALVEGPRVLDFGCGTGDLLMLLQEAHPDWQLTGVDMSGVALSAALDNGFNGVLLHDDRVKTGRYDTIIASQVLEHVRDDRLIINDFDNALEPGGLLIVSVPNDGAIQSPDHKRDYTPAGLRRLLSHVGEPVLHSWPGERTRILMSVRKGEGHG
jgi:2-polyprenyl-3-methyl-5-hydroxy-6-metoxy-1,4-benzoquinol methylase